jgi:hypothetical protein
LRYIRWMWRQSKVSLAFNLEINYCRLHYFMLTYINELHLHPVTPYQPTDSPLFHLYPPLVIKSLHKPNLFMFFHIPFERCSIPYVPILFLPLSTVSYLNISFPIYPSMLERYICIPLRWLNCSLNKNDVTKAQANKISPICCW